MLRLYSWLTNALQKISINLGLIHKEEKVAKSLTQVIHDSVLAEHLGEDISFPYKLCLPYILSMS